MPERPPPDERPAAESRVQLHAAIASCAEQFAENRDLMDVLKAAVSIIRNHMHLDRVGFFLYDEAQCDFAGTYGTDDEGKLRDERRHNILHHPDSPVSRTLAGQGDEFFVEEYAKRFPNDPHMQGVDENFFIALKAQGKLLGAISVDNKISGRHICEGTREDLRRFARYLALAIENVQLVETVRQKNEDLEHELRHSRELLDELNAVNRQLRDFAHIVSHDLKAPLRAINQLSTWLEEDYGDRLDEEGRRKVKLLSERARRMHELVEGILAYAQQHRKEQPAGEVDSRAVAERVVRSLALPEGVALRIEGAWPSVEMAKAPLEQVIQNLVGNALEHLGRPEGEIVLSARREAAGWWFDIRDNGVGFSETEAGEFLAGERAHGTGFGLQIVKDVLKARGGRLAVSSKPGEGSVFSFYVPDAKGGESRHA